MDIKFENVSRSHLIRNLRSLHTGKHKTEAGVQYTFGFISENMMTNFIKDEGCFGFLQQYLAFIRHYCVKSYGEDETLLYRLNSVERHDEFIEICTKRDIKEFYLAIQATPCVSSKVSKKELLLNYKKLFEEYAERNDLQNDIAIRINDDTFPSEIYVQLSIKWFRTYSLINAIMSKGRDFNQEIEKDHVTKFLKLPLTFIENSKIVEDQELDWVFKGVLHSYGLNHNPEGKYLVDKLDVNGEIIKNFEKQIKETKEAKDIHIMELKKKLANSKKWVKVRSRHGTHDVLRGKFKTLVPIVIRMGSQTSLEGYTLNHPDAILNAANKKPMKDCFDRAGIKHAVWVYPTCASDIINFWNDNGFRDLKNPAVIVKALQSSRGRGIYKFNSLEELSQFFTANKFNKYIVEKFYNFSKEYRIHVTDEGCFYTCRKMLKSDTTDTDKWHRHDTNSVWIMEENEMFEKPSSWDTIVEHCVKALQSTGLDFGACDVIVTKDGSNFIICEINSAPSFGEVTAQKYIQMLEKKVFEINKQVLTSQNQ